MTDYRAEIQALRDKISACHPCDARMYGLELCALADVLADRDVTEDSTPNQFVADTLRKSELSAMAQALNNLVDKQNQAVRVPRVWGWRDDEPDDNVWCVVDKDDDYWYRIAPNKWTGEGGNPERGEHPTWINKDEWDDHIEDAESWAYVRQFADLTEVFLTPEQIQQLTDKPWEKQGADSVVLDPWSLEGVGPWERGTKEPPPAADVKYLLVPWFGGNKIKFTRIGTGDRWRGSDWPEDGHKEPRIGYFTFSRIMTQAAKGTVTIAGSGPTYEATVWKWTKPGDRILPPYPSFVAVHAGTPGGCTYWRHPIADRWIHDDGNTAPNWETASEEGVTWEYLLERWGVLYEKII